MGLNNTQRNILDAILGLQIDGDDDSLIGHAIFRKILQDISINKLDDVHANLLKLHSSHQTPSVQLNLGAIEQIVTILTHPYPQNRSEGNSYLGQEPGMAVWRDDNYHINREPLGILSLTTRNDNTADPVTRDDVVGYVTQYTKNIVNDMERREVLYQKAEERDITGVISMIREPWVTQHVKDKALYTASMLQHLHGNNNLDVIKLLIAEQANPSAIIYHTTVIHNACQHKNFELVDYFLSEGANINTVDQLVETPLFNAARDDISIVEKLVDRNSNVNAANNNGRTPTDKAISWGRLDIVEFLLGHGASISAVDKFGNTLLHRAAVAHSSEFIEKYHDHFDINAKNSLERTPLHEACWFSSDRKAQTISSLLSYGCALEELDERHSTPLGIASSQGNHDENVKSVAILLLAGANPNSTKFTDAYQARRIQPLLIAFGKNIDGLSLNEDVVEKSRNIEPILRDLGFEGASIIKARTMTQAHRSLGGASR
jgi:ankyrin repeat protein